MQSSEFFNIGNDTTKLKTFEYYRTHVPAFYVANSMKYRTELNSLLNTFNYCSIQEMKKKSHTELKYLSSEKNQISST